MKKDLLERIKTFESKALKDYLETGGENYGGAVYFTRAVPDVRFKKKKYFFKYENTHSVRAAFTTQKELSDFLNQYGI